MSFEQFLIELVLILAAAKIGGEVAERLKQPAVLGELVAGILIGGPIGWLAIDPNAVALQVMAEIGAVLLLFEAGLESDVDDLRRLGPAALWVAFAGVALPFILGYAVALLLNLPSHGAIFLGAALTATSVGITTRTFQDLRVTERPEARIVLGAAVADDVIGLVLLAVVSGIATSGSFSLLSGLKIAGFALAFLIGSVLIGIFGAPFVMRLVARMRTRAALSTMALIFCFLMAALAHRFGGLAPIVGAFAAGLVLSTTEHKLHFEARLKPVADIFIPIFFVLMGAAMPIGAINPTTRAGQATLLLALALVVVGVVGKVVGGMTVPVRGLSRLMVGVGMVPRGEVGLIFANVGLTHHLIARGQFTAIVLMVMATTFVTPPLLKRSLGVGGATVSPALRAASDG